MNGDPAACAYSAKPQVTVHAPNSGAVHAQERAQRGRRPYPVKQIRHRPVPQHVHVIDAVGARCHPGNQAADLHLGAHPARSGDRNVAADQDHQTR
jgi:hypothetical protein